MSDMSDWEVVKEPSTKKIPKISSSDWEVIGPESDNEEDENLVKSLAYSPFRIGKDLALGAWNQVKKVPELYEKGKTEIPGFFNPSYPIERTKQTAAGLLELGQMLNHLPKDAAEYYANRLHLFPKKWAENVPVAEDINPFINQYLGEPEHAGSALARGIGRNSLNILPEASAINQIRKLAPSNLLRSTLSPEQLEHNLRITQGTETGLGDVIGNPFLKRQYENVLSKIPFSGVNEAMQNTGKEIVNRGHHIMESLAGNSEIGNLDQYLNDALKETYKSHHAEKNAHFNNANRIAEESGLQLELPNFAQAAKKHKAAIEDTNILKYDPELQSLVRKLGNYENPTKEEMKLGRLVDEQGKPLLNETKTTYPTLQEANLLKGKLNQLSNLHGASINPSDRHLADVFGDLSRTLRGDIEGAIEKSGNEKLKAANKKAQEYYANNFSPFLDKQIYSFINGNSDPETLVSSFIKTGKSTDRANLINKITNKLPEKDRNLLGYSYLQRALDENGNLNPLKLRSLINKNALGPKQFEALFPNPVIRGALSDLRDLVGMNEKALSIMQNPLTGQMATDILPFMSKNALGSFAQIPAALLGARKLRNENTRTKLVNKMIKKAEK